MAKSYLHIQIYEFKLKTNKKPNKNKITPELQKTNIAISMQKGTSKILHILTVQQGLILLGGKMSLCIQRTP